MRKKRKKYKNDFKNGLNNRIALIEFLQKLTEGKPIPIKIRKWKHIFYEKEEQMLFLKSATLFPKKDETTPAPIAFEGVFEGKKVKGMFSLFGVSWFQFK
jgi:hypothetical protein